MDCPREKKRAHGRSGTAGRYRETNIALLELYLVILVI